jgi:hypothetical protein
MRLYTYVHKVIHFRRVLLGDHFVLGFHSMQVGLASLQRFAESRNFLLSFLSFRISLSTAVSVLRKQKNWLVGSSPQYSPGHSACGAAQGPQ